ELMASYWPTPLALKNDPKVAEGMNSLQKVVFSRTLDKASWKNTKLVKGNLVEQVRKMKAEPGEGLAILGSGSIVSQLALEGLIDEYQIVLNPVVLGKGRTMFDGIKEKLNLKLIKTRTFGNGSVVLWYEPQARKPQVSAQARNTPDAVACCRQSLLLPYPVVRLGPSLPHRPQWNPRFLTPK